MKLLTCDLLTLLKKYLPEKSYWIYIPLSNVYINA